MPPSLAAIPKSTVKALRKGDAGALESVFRTDYDALMHDATKQLGDADGAPLVVQNAMLQVWEERGNLETPEELDKALRDAVHGFAVREARHRQAEQGKPAKPAAGPKTADQVWANVTAAMQAPKADGPVHKPLGDPTKHHAAPHIAQATKRSLAGPIVAGLAIVAITAGILWWLNRKGEETAITRSFSSPKAQIASSAQGQRSSVTLPDSSTVRLGADSKVIVPPGFGDPTRALKLEGTATFVVTASESRPFDVRAGNYAIVAKGTEFTVRAFINENTVTVRVKEGQVKIQGAAQSRTLTAGQAVAIAKDGAMKEPSAAELLRSLGWTDGRFVVDNLPLRELLPELKRWYPLDPGVKDKALLERVASMNVSLDSTKVAIAALEKSASVKFTYEGLKTFLSDAKK